MAKLHRYYVSDMELTHDFWMKDAGIFHQWIRVLRYEVGREVVLFNPEQKEKLYRITKIGDNAIQVELITELVPKYPSTEVYLCFSLLKKDKNEWVLQKGTELGVSHFVPLVCDRTEKTGFDAERAVKIVTEAAEQCGRADIPRVREPIRLETAINELQDKTDLYVAEQGSSQALSTQAETIQPRAILVGPEGGWTEAEKQLFVDKNLKHLALSEFTLRAETAAITATAMLQ